MVEVMVVMVFNHQSQVRLPTVPVAAAAELEITLEAPVDQAVAATVDRIQAVMVYLEQLTLVVVVGVPETQAPQETAAQAL